MFATDQEKIGFARRMAGYYGAVFVIYGVQLPYLPVWLDWRGLTPTEIGLVGALPLFARIILTPAAGLLADRSDNHRLAVVLLSWLGAGAAVLLLQADSFASIAVLVFLLLVATYTALPLAETIAMSGARSGALDYGRMRLWGSLSFIAANVAGGLLIAGAGPAVIGAGLAAGAIATVVAAHVLPRPATRPHPSTRRFTADAARQLAFSPPFLLLMLAAGTIQGSHAVFYAFGVLHWREIGLSAGWTGTLWAIGVLVEVALLALSGRAVQLLGPVGLLLAGGVAGALRWTVMAFDPPLAVLIPLQVLHAATFAATHLGTIHLASTLAPEGTQGTAQALLSAMTAGLAMGTAMAAAGPLYAAFGAASYIAMSVLCVVGIVAALAIRPSAETH